MKVTFIIKSQYLQSSEIMCRKTPRTKAGKRHRYHFAKKNEQILAWKTDSFHSFIIKSGFQVFKLFGITCDTFEILLRIPVPHEIKYKTNKDNISIPQEVTEEIYYKKSNFLEILSHNPQKITR